MIPTLCGFLTAPTPVTLHVPVPVATATGALIHRDPFGLPQVATSAHFALRWDDEIEPTDRQIEAVLNRLEESWVAGVEEYGMTPPIASDVAYVNVILGNSGDLAPPIDFLGGYVTVDAQQVPYVVLATDLLDLVDSYSPYFDGVVIHEVFHVLQFSSGAFSAPWPTSLTQYWFWEGTANWFAHQVQPDNAWSSGAAGIYTLNPWLAADHYDSLATDLSAGRQYQSMLLAQYLTEHVATPELIPEAWISGGSDDDPLEFLDGLLAVQGGSLHDSFPGFATHNAVYDYVAGDNYADWAATLIAGGEVDGRHIAELDAAALPAEIQPTLEERPRAWGYNLLVIDDPPATGLELTLTGEAVGSLDTPAAFHLAWVGTDAAGHTHGTLAGPVVAGTWTLVEGPFETLTVAITAQPEVANPDEAFDYALTVAALPPPATTSPTTDSTPGTTPGATPTDAGEPAPASPDGEVAAGGCGCTSTVRAAERAPRWWARVARRR